MENMRFFSCDKRRGVFWHIIKKKTEVEKS